jgi:hypothetical protein
MKDVLQIPSIDNRSIVTREDEDRRRRENMMLEEERLKREKYELDYRY